MLNNNYYDIILILQRYNIFFINKIFEKNFLWKRLNYSSSIDK